MLFRSFSTLIYKIVNENKYIEIKFILAILIYFITTTARPDTKLIASVIIISYLPLINQHLKLNTYKFMVTIISVLLTLFFLYNIWERSSIANLGRVIPIPIWEHVYRITSIPLGAFGGWGLGSLEIDLPALVSVTTNFLILGILVLSLKFSNLILNFSKFVLLIFIYCIPLFVIIQSNLQVGEWYQPRYILPLFFPLIFLCINSLLNSEKIITSLIFFISSLGTFSFVIALHTTARRYTHGSENFTINLNSNFKWWWSSELLISPMLTILMGTLSYTIIFYLLFKNLKRLEIGRAHV